MIRRGHPVTELENCWEKGELLGKFLGFSAIIGKKVG